MLKREIQVIEELTELEPESKCRNSYSVLHFLHDGSLVLVSRVPRVARPIRQ